MLFQHTHWPWLTPCQEGVPDGYCQTKIVECKETIASNEKSQKDGKAETQRLHQERHQLKVEYLFLKTCFYLNFVPSGSPLFGRITNWMEMWWHERLVWAAKLWATHVMLWKFAVKVTSSSTTDILQLLYIWNYVKKQQELGVCNTLVWHMELSDKIK